MNDEQTVQSNDINSQKLLLSNKIIEFFQLNDIGKLNKKYSDDLKLLSNLKDTVTKYSNLSKILLHVTRHNCVKCQMRMYEELEQIRSRTPTKSSECDQSNHNHSMEHFNKSNRSMTPQMNNNGSQIMIVEHKKSRFQGSSPFNSPVKEPRSKLNNKSSRFKDSCDLSFTKTLTNISKSPNNTPPKYTKGSTLSIRSNPKENLNDSATIKLDNTPKNSRFMTSMFKDQDKPKDKNDNKKHLRNNTTISNEKTKVNDKKKNQPGQPNGGQSTRNIINKKNIKIPVVRRNRQLGTTKNNNKMINQMKKETNDDDVHHSVNVSKDSSRIMDDHDDEIIKGKTTRVGNAKRKEEKICDKDINNDNSDRNSNSNSNSNDEDSIRLEKQKVKKEREKKIMDKLRNEKNKTQNMSHSPDFNTKNKDLATHSNELQITSSQNECLNFVTLPVDKQELYHSKNMEISSNQRNEILGLEDLQITNQSMEMNLKKVKEREKSEDNKKISSKIKGCDQMVEKEKNKPGTKGADKPEDGYKKTIGRKNDNLKDSTISNDNDKEKNKPGTKGADKPEDGNKKKIGRKNDNLKDSAVSNDSDNEKKKPLIKGGDKSEYANKKKSDRKIDNPKEGAISNNNDKEKNKPSAKGVDKQEDTDKKKSGRGVENLKSSTISNDNDKEKNKPSAKGVDKPENTDKKKTGRGIENPKSSTISNDNHKEKEEEIEKEDPLKEKREKIKAKVMEKRREKNKSKEKNLKDKTEGEHNIHTSNITPQLQTEPIPIERNIGNDQTSNKQRTAQQPKITKSSDNKLFNLLVITLKSGYIDISKKISIATSSRQLHRSFQMKDLLFEKISSLMKQSSTIKTYLSKYDLFMFTRPFTLTKIASSSINLISKEDERSLCKKPQPREIINLFTIIYIILDESHYEVPTKDLVVNLVQVILNKYEVDSIKSLILDVIPKKAPISEKQLELLIEVIELHPNILSPNEMSKISKAAGYLCYALQEFYDYVFEQYSDGTTLNEIKKSVKAEELLENRIQRLQKYL